MKDEKEYHNKCDELFARIEAVLLERDADFDSNGNVIEIETAAGAVIINRQPAVFEVWLAAPSGGHHFRWQENDNGDNGGDWQNTRGGDNLMTLLENLLQ